jgi:catechol 2,3-dioxygenase-like lactoylglutathione lyase family enzyme
MDGSKDDPGAPAASSALGYVILYVEDVEASLAFYERAFGLARRFFHDEGGKAYGELETGAARLAFASPALVAEHFSQPPMLSAAGKPPLGIEVALLTSDVQALYDRAVAAGAAPEVAPETKPWGQVVAYVRDPQGFLVEICTPMP